jgi:GNAT superfamily N-acetyltransferase
MHADIRRARPEDAAAMAQVHVESWRQTYRGIMSDELLDDPGLLERRVRFWTAALTDERFSGNRVAVAERDGRIVGIAMSGPASDATEAARPTELYLLYLLADHHGSGLGRGLLDAVLGDEPASLWVADPNPRAQAFYRKADFRPDGEEKVEEGIHHLHLVRGPTATQV